MLACLLACLLAWSGKKTICGGSGGSPACDAAAFSFVLPPSFSCLFGPVSRFLAAPQALFFVSPPVHRRAQNTLFRYPRQLEKALGTGNKPPGRTKKNCKYKSPRRHFFPSPFFPHPPLLSPLTTGDLRKAHIFLSVFLFVVPLRLAPMQTETSAAGSSCVWWAVANSRTSKHTEERTH